MRPESSEIMIAVELLQSLDLRVGWKDMVYIDYWGHHFGE
jgi:hypothetical protein